MGVHALGEGIGQGISFAGARGWRQGGVVATAIGVHNVPEGLAVSLARRPRARGGLVAIATSLPQPALAVPAFLFAEAFAPVRALGLGFAAGSMLWITFAEILPDALRDAPSDAVATAATSAATLLLALEAVLEALLDDEAGPMLSDAAARWHGRLDALEAEAAAIVEPPRPRPPCSRPGRRRRGQLEAVAAASPRCAARRRGDRVRRFGGVLRARAAARPRPTCARRRQERRPGAARRGTRAAH